MDQKFALMDQKFTTKLDAMDQKFTTKLDAVDRKVSAVAEIGLASHVQQYARRL